MLIGRRLGAYSDSNRLARPGARLQRQTRLAVSSRSSPIRVRFAARRRPARQIQPSREYDCCQIKPLGVGCADRCSLGVEYSGEDDVACRAGVVTQQRRQQPKRVGEDIRHHHVEPLVGQRFRGENTPAPRRSDERCARSPPRHRGLCLLRQPDRRRASSPRCPRYRCRTRSPGPTAPDANARRATADTATSKDVHPFQKRARDRASTPGSLVPGAGTRSARSTDVMRSGSARTAAESFAPSLAPAPIRCAARWE